MLMALSRLLIAKLLPDTKDDSLIQACEYGCEILLYNVLSTLGLLLIGILTGFSFESFVIIIIFYLLQGNGGGYHATSHIMCFFTMVIGLLCGEVLLSLHLSTLQYSLIGSISFIILLLIPVHLNKNKRYLSYNLDHYMNRSRLISVFVFIGTHIFLYLSCIEVFNACCVALMLSSISRSYAKLHDIDCNKTQ